MAQSANSESETLMREAHNLAKDYIDLLRAWIPKREATVAEIRGIAVELRQVKTNSNIAKVAGGGVAVLGGIAAIAGTVMTGGLGGPLFLGGFAAAVTGGLTTAGTQITESLINRSKMKKAQTSLDADAEFVKKIEAKKAELDPKLKEISQYMHVDSEQAFGVLLLTTVADKNFPDPIAIIQVVSKSSTLLKLLGQSVGVESALGKGIATSFAEVTMKGAGRAVGTVLGRLAAGAMVVWDAYQLVQNSIELANGSKSEASDSLQKVADGLAQQASNLKTVLERISEESVDFEKKLKEKFRESLEKVSAQGYASDDDAQGIYNYMMAHASMGWRQAFTQYNCNLNEFVFNIARVFRNIGKAMEDYLNENDPQRRRHLNMTLIAHGRIRPEESVPCQIYYMTPILQSVTLYPPWGCAIDASVVYGIATSTLFTGNVTVSANVVPGLPLMWNHLPEDLTETPNVLFTPVLHGEGAHQDLLALIALLQGPADGLVIPYFTGVGNDMLPFPELPLWVCSNAIAVCGFLLGVSCSLRVASCLSPENVPRIVNHLGANGYLPGLNQYCQVPMNLIPAAFMTNHLTQEQRIIRAIQRIRNLFL